MRARATERRRAFLRRGTAVIGVVALAAVLAGCSDTESDHASSSSAKHASDGATTGGATGGANGSSSSASPGVTTAEELAAAKSASKRPSGQAGVPAPNDDDGARNVAPVDPTAGPQPQNASGSIGADPLVDPTPTLPEPGRPDVEGLQPLDWCDDIAAPFYRAVTTLNPNSSASTIVDGVKDLSAVAARAQAPIADAVQTLVTTAQAASADAARAQDFAGARFQGAVKTVHVYLGDACGR